jgi:hypothetical protein
MGEVTKCTSIGYTERLAKVIVSLAVVYERWPEPA